MCARRRSHFLLSRQEKVTKEKATPLSASLRFATGNLRCSRLAGSAQTRFAQTCAALFPPAAALLGAHRGEPGQQGCCAALSFFNVLARAERSDGPS